MPLIDIVDRRSTLVQVRQAQHSILVAKIHILIIASVSEDQPTTWVSFFFDLHICVFGEVHWCKSVGHFEHQQAQYSLLVAISVDEFMCAP